MGFPEDEARGALRLCARPDHERRGRRVAATDLIRGRPSNVSAAAGQSPFGVAAVSVERDA